jgi:hypothetical protein
MGSHARQSAQDFRSDREAAARPSPVRCPVAVGLCDDPADGGPRRGRGIRDRCHRPVMDASESPESRPNGNATRQWPECSRWAW